MKRTLILLALLLPTIAQAQYLGVPCQMTLDTPLDPSHYRSAAETLKAFDSDEAPTAEVEAALALCPDQGCLPWVPFDWRDGVAIHVVIPDDQGGFYAMHDVGWIGGNSACNIAEPSINIVADRVYAIEVHERTGEMNDSDEGHDNEDLDYCTDDGSSFKLMLIDMRSSRILLSITNDAASGHPHETLVIKGGKATASACGLSLDASLPALLAGTAALEGRNKIALALLKKGREATREKKYDEAVQHLNNALLSDPSMGAIARSELGYAMILASSKPLLAEKILRKALTQTNDPRLLAPIWFNLGLLFEKQSRLDVARECFSRSHAIKPSKAAAEKLAPAKP